MERQTFAQALFQPMLYGQFNVNGVPRHAQIELATPGQIEGATAYFIGHIFNDDTRTGESAPVAELEILPPIIPSKLFAIGLNYAAHVAEHNNTIPKEPLMWFKAPSSLLAHGKNIEIAVHDHKTDHEAELAIVIGKRGKAIPESEAMDYVFGYAPSQDISDRVIQRGESQWARGKSFDTYSPFGPFIDTDFDPTDAAVQTVLNGEVKQSGRTSQMLFSPARIISFISQHITLEAGDVIMTGTPEGVSALKTGDVLETRIEGMVTLVNPVV